MRVEQPPLLIEDYTVIFQAGLKHEPVGTSAFERYVYPIIKSTF